MKEGVKRLHRVNKNNNIINTYIDRELIENKLIDYNKIRFQKIHDTIIHRDKVYIKLQNNEIGDKILNREIEWDNYNHDNVY